MAECNVKFTCGCGFQTADMVLAVAHVVQKGHGMEATGRIIPGGKKK